LRFSTPLSRTCSVASLEALCGFRETFVAIRTEFEEGLTVPNVEIRERLTGRKGRKESRRSEGDASGFSRLRETVSIDRSGDGLSTRCEGNFDFLTKLDGS
jgi:hypothetical protein